MKTTILDIANIGEHLICYIVNGEAGDLSDVNMMDVDDYLEDISNSVRDEVNPYYEGFKLNGLSFEISDDTSFAKCEVSGMWNTCHEVRIIGHISETSTK